MTKLITKKWTLLFALIVASICCFQQNLSAQCAVGETGVDIIVDTNAGFAENEIGWTLLDGTGGVVSSSDCASVATDMVTTTSVCLTLGSTYTFQAYDTFGDGWNGNTAQILGNANGSFDGCIYVDTFSPNGLNQALPPSAGAQCFADADGFPNEMEAEIDFIAGAFDNIALTGASVLNDGCSLTDSEVLTVSVANLGCSPAVAAGDAEVTVSITDGPNGPVGPITEALPSIGAEGTVDFSLATTFDLSTPGTYTIDISVDFTAASGITDVSSGDNGVVGASISSLASFGSIDGDSPAYVESFEAGDGGWTVLDQSATTSTMVLGTPPAGQVNINSANDGTQAWFSDLSLTNDATAPIDEQYNADEAIFFLSGCFDMSCMTTATFSIDVNWDCESAFDGASVSFSLDGGGTFTQLGVGSDGTSGGNGTNWYNDPDIASHDIFGLTDAPGWSGDCVGTDTKCSAMKPGAVNGWLTATHNIDFLAGSPSVIFAIVYTSDGSVQDGDGFAFDNVQVIGNSTDAACIGCSDINACNFDGSAYDDGSCEYLTCAGCTDAGACNYDSTATLDDGSCDYSCLGCTDMNACNYDSTATLDDGSCVLGTCGDGTCDIACGEDIAGCVDCLNTVLGCTDAGACNYNPSATDDDGSCEYLSCAGCTDMTACNYKSSATIDDGSCIYGSCGNGICEPFCGETAANCNDCAIRLGCTDPTAHNYRPRANQDDGSCLTCSDGLLNGDEVAIDCGGAKCLPCIEGCMDVAAHNYDATAQVDDGSCETCTDGILNGDETAIDCGGSLCAVCGDVCGSALDISCGDVVTGNTGNFTNTGAPAFCGTTPGTGGGVWYTVDAAGEVFTASLCGSSYDTKINVYSGDCGSLTCVGGNDDFCSLQSQTTWSSVPGTTYYIYVNGFSTNTGNYNLDLSCTANITIEVNNIVGVSTTNSSGTGSVIVTVTSGIPNCALTYSWTGPGGYTSTTKNATGITMAGNYTLTVTDCNGNTQTITVTVPTRGRGRGRKTEVVETTQLMATPNPFANQTMISFEVNTEERVSLDVFDIRGAKVATLFDETAEAGQNYQLQFGDAMPSGTYIAKLTTANGHVQHIKLFLTK
ncbi:MAG: T9SS type A sorting domain-containing protein [Chitinophagales bacterium]